ncbi:hypothetical protein CSG_9500 [Campylobacter fetus subsp. venerealis str. 84-112]|uniref:Uncharacterized protein n=1 Tax=Campylobacter fetus subsp. fetus (strain 82-40) TaxID=360106 RepID=A0RPS5_CAMFF|nr:hypothetical protein CFF8240_1044 [Campylobacter fetus subsp. fetus 82-40]CDF64861.1 hypothetical protein CSG_9500 [Campylobacter fetus subsp. venerealis str. 84-112]
MTTDIRELSQELKNGSILATSPRLHAWKWKFETGSFLLFFKKNLAGILFLNLDLKLSKARKGDAKIKMTKLKNV